MLLSFATALVFLIVAVLFILVTLFVGRFFRPHSPEPVKGETYECGEPAVGPGWINFNIRFYLIALVFVIFDVEVALMFPVVSVFRKWTENGLGWLAFAEIGLFVGILVVALVYVWAKGDLEWVKKISS